MRRAFLIILILILGLAIPSLYAEDVETEESQTEESVAKDTAKTEKATTRAATMAIGSSLEELDQGSVGKGALLSPLLSESFQTDLATGAATVNIPIVVPPGRKNMQPSLALSYSNNNPNSVCGVGWALTGSSIQRSTKKGPPKYDNTDTFVFASSGSSGELVLIDAASGEYRQKIETAFMKYVFDTANSQWLVWDKAGTKYTFGSIAGSRITDATGTKIFAWFLDRVEDVYGNTVLFTYEKDGGQIYLSKVDYTANASVTPALLADKRVEFVYETGRSDIIYNNRTTWQITTAKRLNEIRINVDGELVWRYALGYDLSADTRRSLLTQVTLFDASGASLSPKKFKYQTIE